LDIKVCQDKIAKEFCQGVIAFASASAISQPLIDATGTLNLIYLVFENHHAMLLEFTKLPNAQAFFDCFKIVTELPEEANEGSH
jgi:hypothetical protein